MIISLIGDAKIAEMLLPKIAKELKKEIINGRK